MTQVSKVKKVIEYGRIEDNKETCRANTNK